MALVQWWRLFVFPTDGAVTENPETRKTIQCIIVDSAPIGAASMWTSGRSHVNSGGRNSNLQNDRHWTCIQRFDSTSHSW